MASALLAWAGAARADWLTARGNAERTGNVDGRGGPATPKVLWAHKAQEHFVGSPVPDLLWLYVPGLGAFNTGTFHCLSLEIDPAQRLRWSKTAPFLKRPTVCSPAVLGGLVVFGDGMHQTDDAILYCVHSETGRSIWQLPVPGKLVHLEGAPTAYKGRVYIGGGDAGVLCVELRRMILEGKEQDFEAIRTLLADRWKQLLAKYEEDKKKDPEFAIPPSEESLPKPSPKLAWQAGKGAWHVDAPVGVARNRVLVASAYLDVEKCGRRSLLCLRMGDGSVAWEVPLKINPWAGVTLVGNTVLVGCSSIRFERNQIPQARGEVLAADLASGQIRWQKDLPGGVLSPVACKDGLAVCTATDGKVRAWNVPDGQEKWTYDAGHPFFAGPAIAGDVVYVADLKAVVHALGLADGKKQWSLDAAADPAVAAPGMVFGSPVVHGGRIYLGTCNLEGSADLPSAVICIADKTALAQQKAAVEVAVDAARKSVSLPCRIAPRKLPHLKAEYPIEVVASYGHPRGQKAHETVVTVEAKPSDVHKALESLGLKPGQPAKGEVGTATGPEVRIRLALPAGDGAPTVVPIENALVDQRTGRPMPPLKWHFTGSARKQPDPLKPFTIYGADFSGTLIALFPVTDETVLQSNLTMREEALLKMDTNKDLLPAEQTAATLIIEVVEPRAAAAAPAPDVEAAPGDLAVSALPPTAAAPLPTKADRLLPSAAEPSLPPAEARLRPILSPAEGRRALRLPELSDPPPLAGLAGPLTAEPRPLAVGPLETEPSPDLSRLPELAIYPPPAYGQTGPEDDRTEGPLRRAVLAARPPERDKPAPFLLLHIPDPFADLRDIQFRRAAADDDPPAADRRLPSQPDLPTDEKP